MSLVMNAKTVQLERSQIPMEMHVKLAMLDKFLMIMGTPAKPVQPERSQTVMVMDVNPVLLERFQILLVMHAKPV